MVRVSATVGDTPANLMRSQRSKNSRRRSSFTVARNSAVVWRVTGSANPSAKNRRNNADKLRPALEQLLYDADKRLAMAQAARAIGHPDAAENVAKVVMEMIAPS